MAGRLREIIDRLIFRRALTRWSAGADAAATAPPEKLRALRNTARQTRRELDRLLFEADYRLNLPLIGAGSFRRLPGTDWAWRPDLWKGPIPVPGMTAVEDKTLICEGTTLFHDCRRSELTLRQLRNTREQDIAPFGVRMDVFRFDGSFLSLVLDLPESAAQGLKLRHLIRLDAIVELEKPLEIFARLNIRHGPNVEQVVRELPLNGGDVFVEFDLAYTRVNEKRIEKLWIDLIFEGPEMNQVTLRDLTISRRPRAEL